VALLPDDHPLAGAGAVRLRQLAGETVLVCPRKSCPVPYEQVLSLYAVEGVRPRVAESQASPLEVSGLMRVTAREGIYFSVASPLTQPQAVAGVAAVALDSADATVPVLLAWRRGESSTLVLDFVASARGVFEEARRTGSITARREASASAEPPARRPAAAKDIDRFLRR
jgi:hypothetical protein